MKTVSSVFVFLCAVAATVGASAEETKPEKAESVKKLNVLFLCTGNSCRSQMAEGWTRHLKGDVIEAYSAGIETHGLNPNAVRVMKEAGVDISGHKSENIKDLMNVPLDYVVTVCGHADEHCPVFPKSVKVIHHPFDDPPKLAKAFEKEEDKLNCYRRVRDEIKAFVQTLPESLVAEMKSNPSDETPKVSYLKKTTRKQPLRDRVLQRVRRFNAR